MEIEEFTRKIEDLSKLFSKSDGNWLKDSADRLYRLIKRNPTEENARIVVESFIIGYAKCSMDNYSREKISRW